MAKKPKPRPATDQEILDWLIREEMVVKVGDSYRMTIRGLKFTASKPPYVVTKYIPGTASSITPEQGLSHEQRNLHRRP